MHIVVLFECIRTFDSEDIFIAIVLSNCSNVKQHDSYYRHTVQTFKMKNANTILKRSFIYILEHFWTFLILLL